MSGSRARAGCTFSYGIFSLLSVSCSLWILLVFLERELGIRMGDLEAREPEERAVTGSRARARCSFSLGAFSLLSVSCSLLIVHVFLEREQGIRVSSVSTL